MIALTSPFSFRLIFSLITFLEDMILHTVDEEMQKGAHYKDIYKICKANGEQIMRFAYLTPGTTSMISA